MILLLFLSFSQEIDSTTSLLEDLALRRGIKGKIVIGEITGDTALSKLIRTELESYFTESDSFILISSMKEVDRVMRRIAEELKYRTYIREDPAKKLGKLLGADLVLLGGVSSIDSEKAYLKLSIYQIETGRKVTHSSIIRTPYYFEKLKKRKQKEKTLLILFLTGIPLFLIMMVLIIYLSVKGRRKRIKQVPQLLSLVDSLMEKQSYAEAYRLLKKAERIAGETPHIIQKKKTIEKICYNDPEKYEQALRHYRRAEEYERAGQIELAYRELNTIKTLGIPLKQALSLYEAVKNKRKEELINRFNQFLDALSIERAEEVLSEIKKMIPDDSAIPSMENALNNAKERKEKFEKLKKQIDEAEKLYDNGEYQKAKNILKEILLHEEIDKAKKLLDAVDKKLVSIEGEYKTAILLVEEGRPLRAEQMLKDFIKKYPYHREAKTLLERITKAREVVNLIITSRKHNHIVLREETLSFGRLPENTIPIEDPRVSRHHAELEIKENIVILRDLGSKNHTYKNQEIIETAIMKDRDRFSITLHFPFLLNIGRRKTRKYADDITEEAKKSLKHGYYGEAIEYVEIKPDFRSPNIWVVLKGSYPIDKDIAIVLYQGIIYVEKTGNEPLYLNHEEVKLRKIIIPGDTIKYRSKSYKVYEE